MLDIFFKLLICHAIADFPLQSPTMAKMKSRRTDIKIGNELGGQYNGQEYKLTWMYWLSSHALTHGGIVLLFTSNIVIAFITFITHLAIDFCKTEEWTDIHQDQAMHLFFVVFLSLMEWGGIM